MSLVNSRHAARLKSFASGSDAVWARLAAERACGLDPHVPVFHHAAPRRVHLFR